MPISDGVLDLAVGTSEHTASSRPRPGEGTSEDRAAPVQFGGRVSARKRIGFAPSRRYAGTCRMRQTESRAVAPHPVQDDAKAAGDGHDGTFHAAPLCNLHAPGLEPTLRS